MAWSLEIEIQFYLVAPLMFLVFRLRRETRNAVLTATTVLFCILPVFWMPRVLTLYNYFGFFLVGTLLAGIGSDGAFQKKISRVAQFALASAAIAAGAVLGPLNYLLTPTSYRLVTPLCIGVRMAAALAHTPTRHVFRWSPLAIIGGMCYSIYLTHNLLLAALVSRGWYPMKSEASGWAFAAAATVLCGAMLAVGVVYKLLEQPFMRMSARYSLVKRPGPAVHT